MWCRSKWLAFLVKILKQMIEHCVRFSSEAYEESKFPLYTFSQFTQMFEHSWTWHIKFLYQVSSALTWIQFHGVFQNFFIQNRLYSRTRLFGYITIAILKPFKLQLDCTNIQCIRIHCTNGFKYLCRGTNLLKFIQLKTASILLLNVIMFDDVKLWDTLDRCKVGEKRW